MRGEIAILGGGLAGLAAGHALARAGRTVAVFERDAQIGGLARTLEHRGQRFDLGGHRLLTDSARVRDLVRAVVREPLLQVPRSSKILLRGRYVDYPLRPLDALSGFGPLASLQALGGYVAAQLAHRIRPRPLETLEDWVVRHYGRSLFERFFKPYSEKVWGLDCARISADWVAQRIQGLTLGAAIRRALLRPADAGPRTLTNGFLYPARGIGRIAEGLCAAITARCGRVLVQNPVVRLAHRAGRIEYLEVRRGERRERCHAAEFVSSLPLPLLAQLLSPAAPRAVLAAAARLRYRDLLLVAVRLARERATDQTWIYVPGPEYAFGRLHEPKNWSRQMGAPGESLLVAEHFCSRGDALWRSDDETLVDRCAGELARLGLVTRAEALDGRVVRVPNAYPAFEVGYEQASATVTGYLAGFANLQLIGRTGAFRYFNMDHAIESGLDAADIILARTGVTGGTLLRTGTDA